MTDSTRKIAVALALAVACSRQLPSPIPTPGPAPPLDSFYYPIGLAVRHQPPTCRGSYHSGGVLANPQGCQTELIVASSNFDLQFDSSSGGTVIGVDVSAAVTFHDQNPTLPPQLLTAANGLIGGARIGSFAGEAAIFDSSTCSTFGSSPTQVLVPSRSGLALYRVAINQDGTLTCGADCLVPLDPNLLDPYGVTVTCGVFPPIAPESGPAAAEKVAFVTYLRSPNLEGWVTPIDLASSGAGSRLASIDVGSVPTQSAAFDPAAARLFLTEHFSTTNMGSAPFRWLNLAEGTNPSSALTAVNREFSGLVRGAELRGIALSNDSRRGYLALRLYDVDLASSTGARPPTDLTGALLVVDLATLGGDGQPTANIINSVNIDRGVSQIRALQRLDPAGNPRTVTDPVTGQRPMRDLVAVTCTDDNTVILYDDEVGAIVQVFDICGGVPGSENAPPPCDAGFPLTGQQPFGLATEQLANGNVRLYVGSFARFWVNVIEIDPANPSVAPVSWTRIGPENPANSTLTEPVP